MVGAGIFLLLYLVVRVGASAHVPIPRGRAATIDTAPSQLGGEFAVLPGSPAAALSTFAQLHQVTEMLLTRSTARTGRHPVLRELVQRAGRAEVHVLPAERPGSAVTAARGTAGP